jgi:hypothetical protein
MTKMYALSIKQPWAALLVHGKKTIEVRRWPTARRGPILIHAARIPDERPEAWAHVPTELLTLARQTGGILGMADLVHCTAYRSLEAFSGDRDHHLNENAWFEPPALYGFQFRDARVLPFQKYAGWMRFFPVEWDDQGAVSRPHE